MIQEYLIYSILENKDTETLAKVKNIYLTQESQNRVDFIRDYLAKYKDLPSVVALEQKFNTTLNTTTEPAGYWFNEVVSKYKENVVDDTIKLAAKNRNDAIKVFQKGILQYNSDHELRVVDYSFDPNRRYTRYEEIKKNSGITYMSSGNDEFDQITKGFRQADLWTIGGTEGIGKTWVILRMANWIDQMMLKSGLDGNILFVSCEVDIDECEERLDSINTSIPYGTFISGKLTPRQERRYKAYLANQKSNIKFVDDCENLDDVINYISLFAPKIVYIDGSHILANSFDWQDIAKLTGKMKKITRVHRVPIINTTHVKSGEGKKGGNVDAFAYSKGYTRDSDIAGVLFADDAMQLRSELGIHFVKVRRGVPIKLIYQNNFKDMTFTFVEEDSIIQQLVLPSSNQASFPLK